MKIREAKKSGITKRQQDVLEKINDFIENNSYPPTIRDLARNMGFSSPKAVTDHLNSLERKGYIERNSLARSMRLTGKALSLLDAGKFNGGFTGAGREKVSYLPLVGRVAAGSPILAEENIDEYIPVPSNLLGKNKADFALKVKGDSMTGDHILNGDIIIVKSQNNAENGDIVVALIENEAVVKKLYRVKDTIELRSSNLSYAPIRITTSAGSSSEKDGKKEESSKLLMVQGKVVAVQRIIR